MIHTLKIFAAPMMMAVLASSPLMADQPSPSAPVKAAAKMRVSALQQSSKNRTPHTTDAKRAQKIIDILNTAKPMFIPTEPGR